MVSRINSNKLTFESLLGIICLMMDLLLLLFESTSRECITDFGHFIEILVQACRVASDETVPTGVEMSQSSADSLDDIEWKAPYHILSDPLQDS
jgi:hypothetical protein